MVVSIGYYVLADAVDGHSGQTVKFTFAVAIGPKVFQYASTAIEDLSIKKKCPFGFTNYAPGWSIYLGEEGEGEAKVSKHNIQNVLNFYRTDTIQQIKFTVRERNKVQNINEMNSTLRFSITL